MRRNFCSGAGNFFCIYNLFLSFADINNACGHYVNGKYVYLFVKFGLPNFMYGNLSIYGTIWALAIYKSVLFIFPVLQILTPGSVCIRLLNSLVCGTPIPVVSQVVVVGMANRHASVFGCLRSNNGGYSLYFWVWAAGACPFRILSRRCLGHDHEGYGVQA